MKTLVTALLAILVIVTLRAADIKVDLSKEQVGKPPVTFEPMVGTWVVTQDGGDKVIQVDGRPWAASKDDRTKLLTESARKYYAGYPNEVLMDKAKRFADFPVAILKSVDNFSNGTIGMKFKMISGEDSRASGILFNVKPNGDWLAVRHQDADNDYDIVLWEFHNGARRSVIRGPKGKWILDRNQWHELRMSVSGVDFKAWIDGNLALEYTLGRDPVAAVGTPNPDLFPANNPVLRPPVAGKVGLWGKTDGTSYFKDFVVSQ